MIKAIVTTIGAIALIAAGVVLGLWLQARPLLDAAHASYDALPAEQRCDGAVLMPHGYPRAIENEGVSSAEHSVYRAAHDAAGLNEPSFSFDGISRSLGWHIYRRAYLSDCEVRAASLHGSTLANALDVLYPGRSIDTLSESELVCVGHAMRTTQSRFCERHSSCCAATVQE
ncbi:MAG: hypothetical protein NT015_15740 [Alphaproteobacteria bacterium]|nr:hypothetical protein [Alphaproteobacteria bacterium]